MSVSCNNPNFIACADQGCMHRSRCCNSEVSGWYCPTDAYCYTLSGMIDCYSTTEPMPTVTINCVDYEDSGTACTGTTSCRTCLSRQYPSCSTEVVVGLSYTNTQVNCYSTRGISTVYATQIVIPGPPTTSIRSPITTETISIITPDASSDGESSITTPTPINTQYTIPTPPPPVQISPGAIAGIAIGGFLALALVLGCAWFLWARTRGRGGEGVAQRGLGGPGGGPHGGAVVQPPQAIEVEGQPRMAYYNQQYGGVPAGAPPPANPIYGGYIDATKAS